MKIKKCLKRSGAWSRRSRKLTGVFILTTALLCAGCRSTSLTVDRETAESRRQTDSVSIVTERTTKTVPVPASRSTLTLAVDSLQLLPVGAGYSEKIGRAAVAVVKAEDGTITVSATCDSLTVLVEELRTEVFHLNAEKWALKEDLKEEKTVEVNRLTSWQSFQIWTGRIGLLLLGFIGIKKFKLF